MELEDYHINFGSTTVQAIFIKWHAVGATEREHHIASFSHLNTFGVSPAADLFTVDSEYGGTFRHLSTCPLLTGPATRCAYDHCYRLLGLVLYHSHDCQNSGCPMPLCPQGRSYWKKKIVTNDPDWLTKVATRSHDTADCPHCGHSPFASQCGHKNQPHLERIGKGSILRLGMPQKLVSLVLWVEGRPRLVHLPHFPQKKVMQMETARMSKEIEVLRKHLETTKPCSEEQALLDSVAQLIASEGKEGTKEAKHEAQPSDQQFGEEGWRDFRFKTPM